MTHFVWVSESPLGHHSDDVKFSVDQQFTFAKNFAFPTTYTLHDQNNEVLGVFHGYF